MAVRIQPNQIQNLQQIEAVVAGPDGANRLFAVSGDFVFGFNALSQGASVQQTQTFTVLIGPVLTRRQFVRAIASASITRTGFRIAVLGGEFNWRVVGADADWDDESGQVELRIEVLVDVSGNGNLVTLNGMAFQATILAAVAQ